MRPLILMPTINSRHLERMLLTAAVCTEMPAPPTGRALLLGGGSAMGLGVQGGYRAVCGRSRGGVRRLPDRALHQPGSPRHLCDRLRGDGRRQPRSGFASPCRAHVHVVSLRLIQVLVSSPADLIRDLDRQVDGRLGVLMLAATSGASFGGLLPSALPSTHKLLTAGYFACAVTCNAFIVHVRTGDERMPSLSNGARRKSPSSRPSSRPWAWLSRETGRGWRRQRWWRIGRRR